MAYITSKQKIVEWATGLLETGCVILDLETTGLSDDPSVAIVEIGIINQHGEVLLETLVKPKRQIPAKASAIHGITNQDVAGAPGFEKLYPQLVALLNHQPVVAYNAAFEEKVLATVCRRYQQPLIAPQKWHCAMRAYAAYRSSRERWVRLEVACKHEKIAIENTHRALGDCRMTLVLLQKMAGEVAK